MENYCLMSIEFHFCRMRKVLGVDGDDVCTTM